MKIAFVHDQLNEFGGAERVLLAMSEIWPEAPIYTAYMRRGSPAWERFKKKDVHTSFMQLMYPLASPLRFLAPAIWNSFNFSEYDVVVSSSSWYITKGFGLRGIKGKRGPMEICYCHTPPRWLYGYSTSRQQSLLVRFYGTIIGFFMRQYDYQAAQKVDWFIANSKETKARIQKFYRRDATVIYPPVDMHTVEKRKRTYYLVVSRLAASKNIDQAILAANKLKVPLTVAGTGPEEGRLRALAGPTITFIGDLDDERLHKLYAGAKAFLALATDEDFGMTPVEAMAAGTPVIAYDGGGYRESVLDGKTGLLYHGDLVSAIRTFEKMKYKPEDSIFQAKKFSKERFKKELKSFVSEKFHH